MGEAPLQSVVVERKNTDEFSGCYDNKTSLHVLVRQTHMWRQNKVCSFVLLQAECPSKRNLGQNWPSIWKVCFCHGRLSVHALALMFVVSWSKIILSAPDSLKCLFSNQREETQTQQMQWTCEAPSEPKRTEEISLWFFAPTFLSHTARLVFFIWIKALVAQSEGTVAWSIFCSFPLYCEQNIMLQTTFLSGCSPDNDSNLASCFWANSFFYFFSEKKTQEFVCVAAAESWNNCSCVQGQCLVCAPFGSFLDKVGKRSDSIMVWFVGT